MPASPSSTKDAAHGTLHAGVWGNRTCTCEAHLLMRAVKEAPAVSTRCPEPARLRLRAGGFSRCASLLMCAACTPRPPPQVRCCSTATSQYAPGQRQPRSMCKAAEVMG